MRALVTIFANAARNAASFVADGYAVNTNNNGPFVVRQSAAKMPNSCWGRYVHIAILELVPGYVGPIPRIDDRNRYVKRIVEVRRRLFDGVTSDCQAMKVGSELEARAAELNARYFRNQKRREQAAKRRENERMGNPAYYRGAVSLRGNREIASSEFCCSRKHKSARAARACIDKHNEALGGSIRLNMDVYGFYRNGETASRLTYEQSFRPPLPDGYLQPYA